jgi:cystathionine beta-synthase
MGKETGAFYTDQFNNPNNPAAHERSTGPEIWELMKGKVDAAGCRVWDLDNNLKIF